MKATEAKQAGYTHHAKMYGVPCYITDDEDMNVTGTNRFNEFQLKFFIWFDTTFTSNEGFVILRGSALTILFLLCAGWAWGQQITIKYPGYTSYWNSQTKIPDSVIWIAKPHTKTVGRDPEFHASDNRPNLAKDYAHSGYDIGHNCDASDENSNKVDEDNSFDYANTFPQRPNNNRLVWLQLENYTRKLNQPVRVKVYWSGTIGVLKPDNVTIPKYTIKELRYGTHFEKYIVPNNDTVSKHNFLYYKVK